MWRDENARASTVAHEPSGFRVEDVESFKKDLQAYSRNARLRRQNPAETQADVKTQLLAK